MNDKSIEFTSDVKPNKRALLEWRWWRPGRLVLLLQERGENGWQTLHRTMLREQNWQRAFAVAATWIGIHSGSVMAVRPGPTGSGVSLHGKAQPPRADTDPD